jgi:protein SCO1/2
LTSIKAALADMRHTAAMSPRLLFLSFVALLGITARPAVAAEAVYTVTGIVRQELDADRRIRIAHDDIPGLMPAMTMAFSVSNAADAAGLKAGDRVKFQLRTAGSAWTVSAFTVIGQDAPAASRKITKTAGTRLREGDAVPAFALLNEDGASFTAAELRERATLITFIFTRCPVPEYCPAMALRFGQLQKAILANPQFASHARLLSITLDPDFDRPAILKAYAEAVGANPEVWHFATGTKEEIATLTKAFAVFTERNGVTLDHTLCTALIGRDGRVLQLWRGNGWKTEEILDALTDALRD